MPVRGSGVLGYVEVSTTNREVRQFHSTEVGIRETGTEQKGTDLSGPSFNHGSATEVKTSRMNTGKVKDNK